MLTVFLNGTLSEGAEAVRCNSSVWLVQPQDYVLYCVKYINKWTGKYLRHGVDKVTENGQLPRIIVITSM